MINPWGWHSILNISKACSKSIRCPVNIGNFSSALVKKIDMTAYGPPQIIRFGEDNKYGYTLIQLLTTSNISAHFAEEDNSIFLDVFSCKKFHPKDVDEVVQLYFKPQHIHHNFIHRITSIQHLS